MLLEALVRPSYSAFFRQEIPNEMKRIHPYWSLFTSLLLGASLAVAQDATTTPKARRIPSTGTARRQKSLPTAFDYIHLEANAKHTYVGVYRSPSSAVPLKQVYTVVTKQVSRDGTEVFFFVDVQDREPPQMIDVNMVGLGAYSRKQDGIYTYDCHWDRDLARIPPKKPKLFLHSSLRLGDIVKVMSDDKSEAYEYTVLAFEELTVPAGRFTGALKLGIRTLHPAGASEQSTAWFGRRVGLIKWIRATGRVDELLSYEEPDPAGAFVTQPINEWVGLRFIFLPQRRTFQKFGYQSVHKPGENGSLPYEKYQGRIAKVTKVMPFEYGHRVELVIEDTQEKIIADAFGDTVNGIAPLKDLQNARAKYRGKTLWTREILNTYNEELDEEGVSISSRYIAVKVVDVVPAWESHQPVRFKLRTESGWEVYLDVHMSDTNVADTLKKYHRFSTAFLAYPPQQ